MREFEIMLHPSPADSDEDLYFAEIRSQSRDGVAGWIELFLQDVDESAFGEQRTANARVMTRMWVDGDEHRDFSYDAVLAILE